MSYAATLEHQAKYDDMLCSLLKYFLSVNSHEQYNIFTCKIASVFVADIAGDVSD